ncbi:MAG TPA: helix-turn-helix domain-containing protein [bacterium]|jgi:transcriptional regulator with XRE-family HTH domain
MSKIGTRIRQARKQAGSSQEDLAERINVNRSYLSLVENGKSSPTFEFLEKIATGLSIKVEDLVLGQSIAGLVNLDSDEGPLYEGLAELLRDEEQMLLMNPSPDEMNILRNIRVDARYHPSKRFFVEALLDYRKNRLAR